MVIKWATGEVFSIMTNIQKPRIWLGVMNAMKNCIFRWGYGIVSPTPGAKTQPPPVTISLRTTRYTFVGQTRRRSNYNDWQRSMWFLFEVKQVSCLVKNRWTLLIVNTSCCFMTEQTGEQTNRIILTWVPKRCRPPPFKFRFPSSSPTNCFAFATCLRAYFESHKIRNWTVNWDGFVPKFAFYRATAHLFPVRLFLSLSSVFKEMSDVKSCDASKIVKSKDLKRKIWKILMSSRKRKWTPLRMTLDARLT